MARDVSGGSRGPKSSVYVGVKQRGRCISVDMRCGRRWEVSGFATERHAGLGHDFFRLLQGLPRYLSLKAEKLNFPDHRALLVQFSKENEMEKFKVVPVGIWDGDKKGFMELVERALSQIESVDCARADDSTEAARVPLFAADIVQGSNGDLGHIRVNGEENVDWDMDRAFPFTDEPSSSNRWFNSRQSESVIHPRIAELEARLSEEMDKNLIIEIENKCLHAEYERLRQQLAGPSSCYEHSRENLTAISPRGAEPADRSETLLSPLLNDIYTWSGEVKDATTFLPKAHEPEVELFNGIQQNCLLGSLSKDNATLKAEKVENTLVYGNGGFGAVGDQIAGMSGVDWNSTMSGTGINTSCCGSCGCNIVENEGAAATPGFGCNGIRIGTGTIDTLGYGESGCCRHVWPGFECWFEWHEHLEHISL